MSKCLSAASARKVLRGRFAARASVAASRPSAPLRSRRGADGSPTPSGRVARPRPAGNCVASGGVPRGGANAGTPRCRDDRKPCSRAPRQPLDPGCLRRAARAERGGAVAPDRARGQPSPVRDARRGQPPPSRLSALRSHPGRRLRCGRGSLPRAERRRRLPDRRSRGHVLGPLPELPGGACGRPTEEVKGRVRERAVGENQVPGRGVRGSC
jgi:hypothetical protein